MSPEKKALKIYVIAGEASGDILASALMRALKERSGGAVEFYGIGGPLMQAQGLRSLFPMEDLSVMGLAEVLPSLGKILGRMRQAVADIEAVNPDILLTADAPDFCFRVARKVRRRGKVSPLMVHYVAPMVWAWRPGRAKKIAKFLDGVICLFPHEPPYFEKEGLSASYAGHPMLDGSGYKADGAALRRALGIGESEKAVAFLPGSRPGELRRTGPILADAVRRLWERRPDIHIICLTFPRLEAQVRELLAFLPPDRLHVLNGQDRKWEAFAACDTGVATSGTVGLELSVAGLPHVIGYRMAALTWFIVDRVVQVDYAHLTNILLGRELVPEFLQDECESERIADGLEILLASPEARQRQLDGFEDLLKLMDADNRTPPSERAASFVLDLYYSRSLSAT